MADNHILIQRGYVGFERIDAGGQANVYRTTRDGALLAIKVTALGDEDRASLDEDLRRELVIINRINHPNCIKMVDMFRTRARVYIVMPFMSNGTLGSMVRNRREGLDEWKIRVWFPPIVRAVKYLHDINIAHRDLKLDNILLDETYNPMVSDFGLSLIVRRDPDTNDILNETSRVGTPSHMPPEMLLKLPYHPMKVDIWAMGVMLFIMANKVYPFDKRVPAEQRYQQQMRRQYVLLPQTIRRISTQLKELIDKLLEPEEALRLTCAEICGQAWFPRVFQEADILIARMRAELVAQLAQATQQPSN